MRNEFSFPLQFKYEVICIHVYPQTQSNSSKINYVLCFKLKFKSAKQCNKIQKIIVIFDIVSISISFITFI